MGRVIGIPAIPPGGGAKLNPCDVRDGGVLGADLAAPFDCTAEPEELGADAAASLAGGACCAGWGLGAWLGAGLMGVGARVLGGATASPVAGFQTAVLLAKALIPPPPWLFSARTLLP